MKKLFAVALALVLSVGIFAGCNASGTSSSAPVSTSAPAASSSASPSDDPTQMTAEITWWAFPTFGQENADDPAGTYEQKIIEAFNEKYPNIKVNAIRMPYEGMDEQLVTAVTSPPGRTPSRPPSRAMRPPTYCSTPRAASSNTARMASWCLWTICLPMNSSKM